MIILDTVNRSLQFVLLSAITTNQLPFSANYVDITATTFTPISANGVSNNTTAVTAMAAPAASTQRQLKNMSVFNADTVAATVIVKYNDNGTLRTLMQATLQPNESIQYMDDIGWVALDVYGAMKSNTSPVGITLVSAKQVSINFGANPTSDIFATVIDPSVTLGTPIIIHQDGGPTPDKSLMGDENEMDPIHFHATPGAGQFVVTGRSLDGPVVGQFNADYIVLPSRIVSSIIGPNGLSLPVALWLKGSSFDSQANGSDITVWPDLSGNAFNAFPIGGVGARPTVARNAINTAMTAAQNINTNRGLKSTLSGMTSGNLSVFAIVKFTTAAQLNSYMEITQGGLGPGTFGMNTSQQFNYHNAGSGDDITSTQTFLLNQWYYIVFVQNGTSYSIYVNGVLWITASKTNATAAYISPMDRGSATTENLNGFMVELAAYRGQLSANDIALLTTYSRNTYGLS